MARVLSIQSHVAYGYVGGKAAVFPLQLLGYDVDVVNTVNYSNHAGYGRAGGWNASVQELKNIFEAMKMNELLRPECLLTGYIPGADPLTVIAQLARQLKSENPDLIYLLDPVLGDSGRLYVTSDVVPVYRAMLPLATIITPNWFEVETLTQIPLVDFPSLQRALKILHIQFNVPNVVISSIPLHSWLFSLLPVSIRPPRDLPHSYLLCLASHRSLPPPTATTSADVLPHPSPDDIDNSISTVSAQTVPLITGYFSGVGDLFSALLLGHFHPLSSHPSSSFPNPNSNGLNALASATSHALSITHAILAFTQARTLSLPPPDRTSTDDEADASEPLRRTRRMRGRELALIQAQHLIDKDNVPPHTLVPWTDFWVSS
ncbi:hypothetical protein AX17_007542 [Amanita inopinata Kibby_2008]|nr:hypothetical protein AX17_007542 [Amanita inopinata Kibby_2008]